MLALFPDVFPDACLISRCVSGCLPCAPLCYLASGGSKISNKSTFSGLGLGILPPAGQRSQKKHIPGKKTRIYIAYIAYIRPYSPISAPMVLVVVTEEPLKWASS